MPPAPTIPPWDGLVPLVDTHLHLTNSRFDADRDDLITGLESVGIWRAMTIGTGLEDARAALALSHRYPERIAVAAGLDPGSCQEAGPAFDEHLRDLDRLMAGGGFHAVGEIGLEYFHEMLPKPVQRDHFAAQLALARTHDLPVVIHLRDAWEDGLDVLRAHRGVRGILHSFSGDRDHARACLDLGLHLSFNGMVTYKANQALRDAAGLVPADRLLVETDAPYLPPLPLRGRRNEPGWVAAVVRLLAEVRGEREDDVAAWTTQNACRLLRLPLPPAWG
jgi:TatD DNase family protein